MSYILDEEKCGMGTTSATNPRLSPKDDQIDLISLESSIEIKEFRKTDLFVDH
jgi:hypothetical protein